MRILRQRPDRAQCGQREEADAVQSRQSPAPAVRVRQGGGRLREHRGGIPRRGRGLLGAGLVQVRHRVRGRPQDGAEDPHLPPLQLRQRDAGQRPGAGAGERRRGGPQAVPRGGQADRGAAPGDHRGVRQGGALRRLHLLQGDRRQGPAHHRFRAGAGYLRRAHRAEVPRVLCAHFAGEPPGHGLRAVHLRRAQQRPADAGGGHRLRALQRRVGQERVEPLPAAHGPGQEALPHPLLPRHRRLRHAAGVCPPAGPGPGQGGRGAGSAAGRG